MSRPFANDGSRMRLDQWIFTEAKRHTKDRLASSQAAMSPNPDLIVYVL